MSRTEKLYISLTVFEGNLIFAPRVFTKILCIRIILEWENDALLEIVTDFKPATR